MRLIYIKTLFGLGLCLSLTDFAGTYSGGDGLSKTTAYLIANANDLAELGTTPADLGGRVDGKIQLSWPTRSGIRVPIRKAQELLLYFTRSDGIYTGKVVVESTSQAAIPTILVQAAGNLEKIQRREFFRVRASLPIRLKGLESSSPNSKTKKTSGMHIISRTVDVSGGGLSIHKEFPVLPGTVFEVELTLEETQPPLELLTTVVYSEPMKTFKGRQLYRVAMQFVDISEASRSRRRVTCVPGTDRTRFPAGSALHLPGRHGRKARAPHGLSTR